MTTSFRTLILNRPEDWPLWFEVIRAQAEGKLIWEQKAEALYELRITIQERVAEKYDFLTVGCDSVHKLLKNLKMRFDLPKRW
ncbi:hypothetical protein VTN96DRAFT_5713 [Rasamsonia emersonii]